MADEPASAGEGLLRGTKRKQGEQLPCHSAFEAGENFELDFSRPSSTPRAIARPREAFGQQTLDLGEYGQVFSPSPSATLHSTDRNTSGETRLRGSQEYYGPLTTNFKRR